MSPKLIDSGLGFEVLAQDEASQARLGVLMGKFGSILTPVFMPVGTHGAIRTLVADEIRDMGFGMILSNALHLYLRPGLESIERLGGLKRFMGYDGGILTDSGGYQVFSLSRFVKIDDSGVTFRSPLDGTLHKLTPEKVIKIQERLGSDIHMPLDHPLGYPASWKEAQEALERTHEWLKASLKAKVPSVGVLFGIVQGAHYKELRMRAAEGLNEWPVHGFALGGFSLGEPKEMMWELVALVSQKLDSKRPRYMMGVGTPRDLLEGVRLGVDMFDCILPTRLARHGQLYTSDGTVRLKNARFQGLEEPLDACCDCLACNRFSVGYLAHLYRIGDPSILRLATLHNLRFYGKLLEKARRAIGLGKFMSWYTKEIGRLRLEKESYG